MNDAAVTNIVLPLVISVFGLFGLIDWLLQANGDVPAVMLIVTVAPLVWAWMHREEWTNRHKHHD